MARVCGFSLTFILFISIIEVFAQKQITIEDFTIRNTFNAKSITGINWMKDGMYYTSLENHKIVKYKITTGEAVATIVDAKDFPSLEINSYAFSKDETKLLLASEKKSVYRRSFTAEYFVYDIPSKKMVKLSANGKQSYATFSPDGSRVAFVRGNNLFYVSLSDMKEVEITSDGKFNSVINGTTDWVYEEEFSFVVGFYWSPDGKKIAYYRFDETDVKEYDLQMWGKNLYPTDYRFKYPKAGESNSKVEIWIADIESGNKTKADLGLEEDIYVPRVQWSNNPEILSIRRMNRLQNKLELVHVSSDGSSRVVLSETSSQYVDIEFVDDLIYLEDGKHFVCTSESAGYKHVFLYSMEGKLIRQITKGNFDVIDLFGVDQSSKMVYFNSTEVSPIERQLFSIHLDGKRKIRLTQGAGQHAINFSTDFQFYIDQYSSGSQPNVASLYKTKGNKLIKVLEKNDDLNEKIEAYRLTPKEFFSFKNETGDEINGYFLKPSNMIAGKKYPLILYQYSGPGSQNVGHNWAGNHFYFHQLLTQQGFIVAVVDPRGTGARGEKFKKMTYLQLGKYELEDLVKAASYFSSIPFVDSDRLGIWGWSYGGYMAALAMTKAAGTFKMGIAVSPVTNWRFYDTIYTERFLQTPQLNPKGYDANSPLSHADKLSGKFLLIHGTGDDNVHFQNSVIFQNALIDAGKQFDSFYYPDKQHSIQGSTTRHHLYTQMLNFIKQNL